MRNIFLIILGAILFCNVANSQNAHIAQNYNKSNESFTVTGKHYRYSSYDQAFKFLGNVTATIEKTTEGFRLTKINGEKVNMDRVFNDLQSNQQGQVTECDYSDDYLFQAHYRKNGNSYLVLFNTDRLRIAY